jgi:hypothetical protein
MTRAFGLVLSPPAKTAMRDFDAMAAFGACRNPWVPILHLACKLSPGQ